MGDTTNNKHNIMQLSKSTKTNESEKGYIPSEQSANALFKFMTKLDYLKDVIKYKAIIPRYYEEMIDYLEIEDLKKIAFPMSCFCDIHLNKLVPHMSFYGAHGIGLNKGWGINQGIQPIHYINKYSGLISDYKFVFSRLFKFKEQNRKIIEDYSNYLLTNLLFMKPMEGYMFRNNNYVKRNFHDEREWRYIPSVNTVETELPQIIPKEQMIPKAYSAYSDGILQCDDLWLKFEYDNIKYLVVKNINDRKELIRFIYEDINANDEEKFILISKILVFNELKEDW